MQNLLNDNGGIAGKIILRIVRMDYFERKNAGSGEE
jgi:hypothetical protein